MQIGIGRYGAFSVAFAGLLGSVLILPSRAPAQRPMVRIPLAAGNQSRSYDVAFRKYPFVIGGKVSINIFVGPPEAYGGGQLAVGLGNKLWYGINSQSSGAVIAFSTTTAKSVVFPGSTGSCFPSGVAENADLTQMVITDNCSSQYEFVTASGAFTPFGTPSGQLISGSIVQGPDNRVWGGLCCNASGFAIAITKSGTASLYQLAQNEQVRYTAVGPDNNIWFTSNLGIGKITTAGKNPTDYSVGFAPSGIVTGSDGKIWFGNSGAAEIGSITTAGTGLTLFTRGISGIPNWMTLGPDKNIYFSEYASSTGQAAVGRITSGGAVTEYTLPYGFVPNGITVGPDGNIWVVDGAHDQLGQLVLKK